MPVVRKLAYKAQGAISFVLCHFICFFVSLFLQLTFKSLSWPKAMCCSSGIQKIAKLLLLIKLAEILLEC